MICVGVDQGGALVALDPQPLAPDALTCPLVVQSFSDLAPGVFSITPEQGGQIGMAVLLVWGVAFAFRAAIRSLSIGDSSNDEDRS